MSALPFRDRHEAMRGLATALARYRGAHAVVLAIPRGAVPMGRQLADELEADFDVVLVRKLGAPGQPELAIGAVDEHGSVTLNALAERSGADAAYVHASAAHELDVIRRRRQRYGRGRAPLPLAGRTVIVVDDGLATGATMRAALQAVRAQAPARVVCAVPVAARDSLGAVAPLADEVVCLATPSPFQAVSAYYRDFATVDDDEVERVLRGEGRHAPGPAEGAGDGTGDVSDVRIAAPHAVLAGELAMPAHARGLVLFAPGGGSRRGARERSIAAALQRRGIGTLLVDLSTVDEGHDPAARGDVPRLAQRLQAALAWAGDVGAPGLPVGLFGSGTGAAAALIVAAAHPREVAAVATAGARVDRVDEDVLAQVRTPVLLLVGGEDGAVLACNRQAQAAMARWASLEVVEGATHRFEEPGALARVAEAAGYWFAAQFGSRREATARR